MAEAQRQEKPVIPVTGAVRERMGTATALAAPHNHYPTRDGKWVAIACTNDRIFARLASLMGRDELCADPRFSRERERVADYFAKNVAL